MKNKYIFDIKVSAESIDSLNHVNNAVYLNWVLKAAELHWAELSNKAFNSQFVWVVLRHEIDYFAAAVLNDDLTITTCIGDNYGAKSDRYVTVKRGSELLVKAKTVWCLLNRTTMKPTRISGELLQLLES